MFSGIVEVKSRVLAAEMVAKGQQTTSEAWPALVRIVLERPSTFDDIKPGDSIACNGVCLTVETLTKRTMTFALAAETLAVTNWQIHDDAKELVGRVINLERSLRMGDRIHGHWVTGHVDAAARVVEVTSLVEVSKEAHTHDGSIILAVEIPQALSPMVWKKGSWAVNGVSLTINSVEGGIASHCLIPETLMRTNLQRVKPGDYVNVEVDVFARALAENIGNYLEHHSELNQDSSEQDQSKQNQLRTEVDIL